jgi:hypothetical protein
MDHGQNPSMDAQNSSPVIDAPADSLDAIDDFKL